jgi:tripartite-type tricarboxylate transporter receptor subunit TctC
MSAWVRSLAIAVVAAAWLAPAQAQQLTSQDIRLICGYPAGSGADVIVRYYAQKLKEITGRTVLVENKVGAMGNLATEYSARAKPDGHTIYLNGGGVIAANMYLFKKPPVDIVKELQAVAGINKLSGMLAVRPDRPWKNLADLTAYLKEKGDKASYASTNPVAQVGGEIYKQKAGLNTVQVSYKTGFDSANDMQSGQVDFAMLDPIYALAQRREGRLRVLAIQAGQRMESVPDIPTFTEQGIPMDLLGWWGAFVPAATPRAIVDQLNVWFVQVQRMPETTKFFNTYGSDPFILTPDQAQARLAEDVKNWADYVKIAKIEPQG